LLSFCFSLHSLQCSAWVFFSLSFSIINLNALNELLNIYQLIKRAGTFYYYKKSDKIKPIKMAFNHQPWVLEK
jgi:hypothetical protein